MNPVVESALISAVATLVGVGGTVSVAYMGFRFSRRTLAVTGYGQIADRYTKAVEQLGSKEIGVRTGGIYALESVARDSYSLESVGYVSVVGRQTVMEVLSAFIREQSHKQYPPPDYPARLKEDRSPAPDVQAAITVVMRRHPRLDEEPIDFSGASLAGAWLGLACLRYADLYNTDLTGVSLRGADLTGAVLANANLTGAILIEAKLIAADLRNADLRNAELDGAWLTGVRWPENVPIPGGWKRDASSGRLVSAGTDSGPTETN